MSAITSIYPWKWIGIPLLLVVLIVTFEMLGNADVYAAKRGQVVDNKTGKGIPNTGVIAAATFGGENLIHGSYHGTLYRQVTSTDADGNFRFPNTWSSLILWIPGFGPEVSWRIAAFQPGYATVGDDIAWTEFDEYGAPKYWPPSIGRTPKVTWRWFVEDVAPIEMKLVELNLKQAAVYYKEIVETARGSGSDNGGAEKDLLKRGYDVLFPQVCALDESSPMDSTEAHHLLGWAPNRNRTDAVIKQLEPENWTKEIYARPSYKAGDVCEAMKAGGEIP